MGIEAVIAEMRAGVTPAPLKNAAKEACIETANPIEINDVTPITPVLHKVESQCSDVFRMLAQMQSDGLKLSLENGMINPTGKRQVIGKWLPELTGERTQND